MNKRTALETFMMEFGFLEKEISGAIDILNRFENCNEAALIFDEFYNSYKDEHEMDFDALCEKIDMLAELSGMHKYELQLLFALLLGAHSEYFYIQKGYGHNLWVESLTDVKWKMRECLKVNGFYGSRTLSWFKRWYFADRVTLGRLQFEIIESNCEYKSENFNIKQGDKLINIHIPEDKTRKFNEENCHKAYEMAKRFFAPILGENIIFKCSSWLLWPMHSELLPEGSNIRRFASDFEIDKNSIESNNSDAWRVFYTDSPIDKASEFPEDTTIQRAYKKHLLSGGSLGRAVGYRK